MDKNKNFFGCNSYLKKRPKLSQSFWNKISKRFDIQSLGPIILQNSFLKISKLLKIKLIRNFILFQNHLVYMNKPTQRYEKISNLDNVLFDTKIKNNTEFSLILTKPDLKIEIEMITNDKKQFEIWEEQLSKICIRTNFEKHYVILGMLGAGNYSKVYLARKILDGNQFAVKVFDKTTFNSDIKLYNLMMNEIKLTRTFSHPCLVQVYEAYKVEGSYSMIMEYMSGGELLKSSHKRKKVSEANCAIIMKNLVSGLQYLRSKRILHRDLKPANILLKKKNNYSTVKIADFGFATYIEEISVIYPRCGTPGYVAPEFLNTNSELLSARINHKADLFSVGCIMYKILTGNSLFQSSNIKDVLKINKQCKIDFNSVYFQQMSRSAVSLLKRILVKDPNNRIDSEEILNHEYFQQDSFVMDDIPLEIFSPINKQLVQKFNMEQLKQRNMKMNSLIKLSTSYIYSSATMNLQDGCFNLSKTFSYKMKSSRRLSIPNRNNAFVPTPPLIRSCSRFNTIIYPSPPLSEIITPNKRENLGFTDYMERYDKIMADKEGHYADKEGHYVNKEAKYSARKRQFSSYHPVSNFITIENSYKSTGKTITHDPHASEDLKIVIEGNEPS